MGRVRSSDVREGYKVCPHCNGETVCDCGSCGVKMPFFWLGREEVRIEKGICKVCGGHGQVPK